MAAEIEQIQAQRLCMLTPAQRRALALQPPDPQQAAGDLAAARRYVHEKLERELAESPQPPATPV